MLEGKILPNKTIEIQLKTSPKGNEEITILEKNK
jgi:hypothetical protein